MSSIGKSLEEQSRRIWRKLKSHRERPPVTLSIVVPFYNVEEYLEECLASVLVEESLALELIAVDDGSPDGSAALVKRIARGDRRVKLIRQANAGLGAARNAGALVARGKYIAFLDSDDLVEPGAYARIIDELEKSGSDFAVTPYRHLRDGKLSAPAYWIRQIHQYPQRAANIDTRPDALANVVAWSKVYRRDFWTQSELSYPVGVVWEDQQAAAKSYLSATAFDILDFPLVRWRLRDGRTRSITQNHKDTGNLRERFQQALASLEIYAAAGRSDLVELRALDFLANRTFSLANIRFGTQEYWDVLVEGIRKLAPQVSPQDYQRKIDAAEKVLLRYILENKHEDARDFLAQGALKTVSFESILIDGKHFIKLPHFERVGEVLRLDDFELATRQRELQTYLSEVQVTSTHFVITGNAYFANVDIKPEDSATVRVRIREVGGPKFFDMSTMRVEDSSAALRTRNEYHSYSGSGFVAKIELSDLDKFYREVGCKRSTFRLEIELEQGADVAAAGFRTRNARSSATVLPTTFRVDSLIVVPSWHQLTGLELTLRSAPVLVEDTPKLNGQILHFLYSNGNKKFVPSSVAIRKEKELIQIGEARAEDNTETSFSIDLSKIPHGFGVCSVVLQAGDGTTRFVHYSDWNPAEPLENSGDWRLWANSKRVLKLAHESEVFFVEEVKVASGSLTVYFDRPIPDKIEQIKLESKTTRMVGRASDKPNAVEFSLEYVHGEGWVEGTIPFGGYSLVLVDLEGTEWRSVYWKNRAQSVGSTESAGQFQITSRVLNNERVEFLLSDSEDRRVTGPNFGERVRRYTESVSHRPTPKSVYLQCLQGDQVNDSQLAIALELQKRTGWDLTWGVLDRSVRVPHGMKSVLVGGSEYFQALRESEYLVFNHEVPVYLSASEFQKVVQTYHGHPFKSMGRSRWIHQGLNELEMNNALEIRRHWNYLLSPSPVASKLYKSNFPVDAEIVEVGHPRNDRLVIATEEERLRIRRRLGIPDGVKAALFAPTWRDYLTNNPWSSELPEFLQPEKLASMLGDEYVLLLRGHPAHGRNGMEQVSVPNLIDVTYEVDVNDLLIACDLGIYDYSSIRFDHAVTRKPMYFFVPDIDRYFDDVPPLLDYRETAPGPLCMNLASLVSAIKKDSKRVPVIGPDYQIFVDKFIPLDDGHATERFVDRVFEGG